MKISATDLAWVAGLLEGEGCFTRKGRTSTARGIVVACQMTDEDVLDRLRRIVGVGYMRGPYSNGLGYKPRFTFQVSGQLAYDLMKLLLPLMGRRRSARIIELMRGFESVEDHVYRMVHRSGRVETTTDLASWLRKRGLSESGLWRTLSGQRAYCKNWKRVS